MLKLNPEQKAIHERAVEKARNYLQNEFDLIEILNDVDRAKLFKKFNCPSLFVYATQILGLSESIAYSLISLARKSREIPELITSGLPISKAGRIVSVITRANAGKLIDFALKKSKREIEAEVARINPKAAKRESIRVISEALSNLNLPVSKAFLVKLRRVQSLESQRTSKAVEMVSAIEATFDEYLYRRDPVVKAERLKHRKKPKSTELCPGRVRERRPLTAAQKHEVFARDKGRCTHVDANGKRCEADRWVEVHHLRPVSEGGSNDPSNLATLCGFHHDLIHQLSLPIEGQVSWLKDRSVEYVA